jgi:hypothetical protein
MPLEHQYISISLSVVTFYNIINSIIISHIFVKGTRVKLSLFIPRRYMGGSWGTAPLILNFTVATGQLHAPAVIRGEITPVFAEQKTA